MIKKVMELTISLMENGFINLSPFKFTNQNYFDNMRLIDMVCSGNAVNVFVLDEIEIRW